MAFEISVNNADLLFLDVDMIVQQCNCLTVTAHGLSQQIKEKLKVDPYGHRKCMKGRKNCAVKEDRGIPGQVKIYRRKNLRPQYVACLFAQFSPGRPQSYYQDILQEHIDPTTNQPIKDDFNQRQEWFKQSLEILGRRLVQLNCHTVAFPSQIGCGLAGGSWINYKAILTEWASKNADKFSVLIAQL